MAERMFVLGPIGRHGFEAPRPLAYGVSITTPDGLVCIGGSDANRHYAEVFHAAGSSGGWQIRPFPGLPVPLAYAAGALLGYTIFVAGGYRTARRTVRA